MSQRARVVLCFVFSFVLVALAGCVGRSCPEPAPCPSSWPAGLDPERILVFAFQAGPPPDALLVAFEQDLQELLLVGQYQIVPAASESAESWPLHCVRNRLEVTIGGDLERQGRLVLWRDGEVLIDLSESEPRDREQTLAGLRFALAARLGLSQGSGSVRDPSSPAYKARLRALRSLAEGQVGEAAGILRAAVERFADDAALHFRLGELLTYWAEAMRPVPDGARSELEADARGLLEEALRHHELSARLGGEGPLLHLAKARTLMALARPRAAEEQLVLALAGWPAQAEAALKLARLRLDRNGAVGLASQLSETISLVDRRAAGSYAELLTALGQAELSAGRPGAAVEAWRRALLVAPTEYRSLRAELEVSLAEVRSLRFEDGPRSR